MNGKQILFSCLVCLIIGYFVGVYLPYTLGLPHINNEPISKGDYYGNAISIFEAIGTCLAVIVALFLNEIRAWFKKVTFDIQLSNNEPIEEVQDIKGTKKAYKYHNQIQFINKGNINAQNCELYLENVEFFTNEQSNNGESIPVGNEPIGWNNNTSTVYIPSQGRKMLNIFDLTAPQDQSSPSGRDDTIKPAEFIFLGLKNIEAKKGRWELSYCLNSTNSRPQRFKFVVVWNGQWEARQTEMKKMLTVKLEQI